jgi:hypothetical protein
MGKLKEWRSSSFSKGIRLIRSFIQRRRHDDVKECVGWGKWMMESPFCQPLMDRLGKGGRKHTF